MGKIFITGDTHGEIEINRLSSKNFHEGKQLTTNDYLIVCGDFGLIWDNSKAEQYWTKFVNQKPWTTLFVDGNHENHHALKEFEIIDMFSGKVGKISDKIFHLKRGEIYNIANKTFFCFGGALSRDRYHRKLNVSYWEEEVPSSEEMNFAINNLYKFNNKIDYIITHTVPYSILSKLFLYNDYQIDPTTKFLDHIYNNNSFIKWYCGHLHIDKDIENISIVYHRFLEIQ